MIKSARYDSRGNPAATDDDGRQDSLTTFVLNERIDAVVSGRVPRMQIAVERAEEVLILGGRRIVQPLLRGTYDVELKGGKVTASQTGWHPGSREVEELSFLFHLDSSSPTPFHSLLATRRLRLGESVVLNSNEVKALLEGEPAPGPILFSLVDVSAGVATYQLNLNAKSPDESRQVF